MTTKGFSTWAKYFGDEMEAGVNGPMDLGNHYAHHHPFPVFDRGDDVFSATDIDVANETDIDVNNDVFAQQNTIVEADIGGGSSAIIDESLNAAPEQSGAIGNVDGGVSTGGVAVDAFAGSAGGPGFFGFGGNTVNSFTDIDVVNVTDIDLANNVTAIQNTVIDLDIGPGSSAIISDALNVAPSQNLAVGNFDGFVGTGEVGVQSEDFVA